MAPERTAQEPALSVVLPSPGPIGLVMRTLAALAAQRIADRLEIVLVIRHPGETPPVSATSAFGWVQIVTMAHWTTMTAARVEGVQRSRAPVVALAEDHSFPEPEWAGALVGAHERSWAAVGPGVVNANPATVVSWANLAIEYGPWLAPVTAGACAHVPGHNSSYKRDLLVAYGDRLESLLEAESVLHWDLRRRGLEVAMEPAARTRHENFSRFGPSIVLRFSVGRLFAASRAQEWPWWKRAVFAAGSAILPVLRTARVWRQLPRVGAAPRVRTAAVAFVLLAFDALGECCGYAHGAGRQSRRLSAIEYDRARFLTAADREAARP